MITTFTWSKGIFSNLYQIYSNGELVGNLKNKSFTQSSKGILNGKEYIFKTNGFFKQSTDIINFSDNKVIGRIEYSNWMTKAVISINNNTFYWKYDNIWNTKWTIFNSNGTLMSFKGSSTSGQIESNLDDAPLLLSGLFVTNYYWQISATIMIVVLIPIMV
jgi:hypothetical protein